jgi:imidazolonepropionase-like amidohydrolase
MPLKSSLIACTRWLLFAVALPGTLSAADFQIEHVTIVSPERVSPMRDALVRVHNGRILAISKAGGAAAHSSTDTIALDGSGLFLAPGLIDSHVHLGQIPGMTPEQEAQHPCIGSTTPARLRRKSSSPRR